MNFQYLLSSQPFQTFLGFHLPSASILLVQALNLLSFAVVIDKTSVIPKSFSISVQLTLSFLSNQPAFLIKWLTIYSHASLCAASLEILTLVILSIATY